jgi:hypothetical protein
MPSDAFLDDYDANPVAAIALHHALQYHWKGKDFRSIDFGELNGQQLMGVFKKAVGLPPPLTAGDGQVKY